MPYSTALDPRRENLQYLTASPWTFVEQASGGAAGGGLVLLQRKRFRSPSPPARLGDPESESDEVILVIRLQSFPFYVNSLLSRPQLLAFILIVSPVLLFDFLGNETRFASFLYHFTSL